MSGPRVGELFAGYGGLGMGVQAALGGEITWYSEIDKGALKILKHRFPDVPNIGDITTVDWSQVEPVDILTGGSPCQDLSHAGKRAGMTEGTRSNLWVAMREAIAQLKPSVIVWENVRGAYSAEADSELGSDPRLLGSVRRRDGEPVLRALGRVLGDLSELGYRVGWHGISASDIGACHGRGRVFVVATTQDPSGIGGAGWETPQVSPRGPEASVRPVGSGGGALLPTPVVNDMGAAYNPEQWDAWTERMKSAHSNGNGHGKSLSVEVQRLHTWNDYAPAVARWGRTCGRPAPRPVELAPRKTHLPVGMRGRIKYDLRPEFAEWMMGIPAGWVTGVPGITRNEALKALGNGVVPQQAEAAVRWLLERIEVAA